MELDFKLSSKFALSVQVKFSTICHGWFNFSALVLSRGIRASSSGEGFN
jgi:hypothetical protein